MISSSSEKPPAVVVALTGWPPGSWLRRLGAALPGRAIVVAEAPSDPVPARHYLFCWKPDPALLNRTPAPLLILSAGAGVDHILKAGPPAAIPITRIVDPDLTGRMVEYVVLHCLMHLRRMTEWPALTAARAWRGDPFPAARQVTVGLMGVGEMGLAAGKALQAIGFDVIGWGRSGRGGLPFPAFAGSEGLSPFLEKTDILVSLLPSTPETRGIIDGALLRRLRRNGPFGAPVLINAGRGDAANEPDLVQALTDGTLRAASLDVFVTEPLPTDHPFWTMENVVITPHNAADSDPDAIVAAVTQEIARFEAGLPPLHGVDRARGY
jgi:glyoxylate/hydroxypyruvate reductase A